MNHDRDVLAAATADRICELQVEALDALEDVLCGPESTAGARLRAAVYVLEGGLTGNGKLDTNRRFSKKPSTTT